MARLTVPDREVRERMTDVQVVALGKDRIEIGLRIERITRVEILERVNRVDVIVDRT